MNSAEGSTTTRRQAFESTSKPVFSTGYSVQEETLRILHVDDDASILSVSKTILETENKFEIDNVNHPLTKLSKNWKPRQYDAIVSDYQMPQKNGLEFLKELREQNNQVPFILFTGKGREDVAVKALNLGVDSYINKNGSPETVYCELADAINKTVERKKSAQVTCRIKFKIPLAGREITPRHNDRSVILRFA